MTPSSRTTNELFTSTWLILSGCCRGRSNVAFERTVAGSKQIVVSDVPSEHSRIGAVRSWVKIFIDYPISRITGAAVLQNILHMFVSDFDIDRTTVDRLSVR